MLGSIAPAAEAARRSPLSAPTPAGSPGRSGPLGRALIVRRGPSRRVVGPAWGTPWIARWPWSRRRWRGGRAAAAHGLRRVRPESGRIAAPMASSGSGTSRGCWTWARQRPSRSATSVAVWNRRAGSLAISRAMIASSQAGTSGLISRSGRGSSSADAAEHGQRRLGPERRMAGAHRVERAAQAEQVGAVVDRLAAGLLRGHVVRRAGHDAAAGQRRRRPRRGPGRSRSAAPARRRSPAGCWPASRRGGPAPGRGPPPARPPSACRSAGPPAATAARACRAGPGASGRGRTP